MRDVIKNIGEWRKTRFLLSILLYTIIRDTSSEGRLNDAKP
jgi:hypothetical protein